MTVPSAHTAGVYTDFDGLAQLRSQARADPNAALHEVARQFESLFLQMMLSSMRDASLGEGLMDNDQSRLYQDMLDKQLGVSLGGRNGIGLAEVLVRQLGGETRQALPRDELPPDGSAPLEVEEIDRLARERALAGVADALARRPVVMGAPLVTRTAALPGQPQVAVTPATSTQGSQSPTDAPPVDGPPVVQAVGHAAHTTQLQVIGQTQGRAAATDGRSLPGGGAAEPARQAAETPAQVGASGTEGSTPRRPVGPQRFDSPAEFVTALWRHAEAAARELGAPPQALLAQAALESGWGKAVARRADGSSSYNLFGIKADRRWQGERLVTATMEFEQGIALRTRDAFRVYDSYADSFSDYVAFLKANPRYTHALERAEHPQAYFAELQAAGYATDPRYASKLNSILSGDAMRDALASIE